MPVRYVVVSDGKLVVERWVGRVTHAEFVEHERQKLQDTSIAREAKALIDARAAEFPETTPDRVHEVADLYGDPDNATRIAAYAAVFGGRDFEMAKSWETQARRHGVNAIVFNNLEVAFIWLGIDPAETQKLLDGLDIR
jgi:hypothetical protein